VIGQKVSAQSLSGKPQILSEEFGFVRISQTLSAKFPLSWSHYLFLMGISNPDERRFYELEAASEGWSLRELKRQFASSLYERLALSRDKAGVKELSESASPFLTRADNSGTHKKELDIWKASGIEPSGNWYVISKGFMLDTLKKADEMGGYFMTDSSTWTEANQSLKRLKILFRGDPVMINTYHTLCQPAGATAGQAVASEFIDFVASNKGQQVIRDFGKDRFGEGLYNDAEYAKQYDH